MTGPQCVNEYISNQCGTCIYAWVSALYHRMNEPFVNLSHSFHMRLVVVSFVPWANVVTDLTFWSQLNCCGPTGTVIDGAKDTCPKKEGLEILITTVTGLLWCCPPPLRQSLVFNLPSTHFPPVTSELSCGYWRGVQQQTAHHRRCRDRHRRHHGERS